MGQPVNPPLMTRKEYSKYGFKQIRELSKIQVQVIKIKTGKHQCGQNQDYPSLTLLVKQKRNLKDETNATTMNMKNLLTNLLVMRLCSHYTG